MSDKYIFKRYEKKYIITVLRAELLIDEMSQYLVADKYGESTVNSLYLDTPERLIIRNSIDAVNYKEKLRIRCYGTPSEQDKVFFEIKKKFNGVVYKRRVSMPLSSVEEYLTTMRPPVCGQIMNEIDYTMRFYGFPMPSTIVSYERKAFFADTVRITFDTGVRYRTDNLKLQNGSNGKKILSDDTVIMEIKTDGAIPLWLSSILDKYEIYPSSFSKYGTAYCDEIVNNFMENELCQKYLHQ